MNLLHLRDAIRRRVSLYGHVAKTCHDESVRASLDPQLSETATSARATATTTLRCRARPTGGRHVHGSATNPLAIENENYIFFTLRDIEIIATRADAMRPAIEKTHQNQSVTDSFESANLTKSVYDGCYAGMALTAH
jgi:hypothetical protein